MWYLPPSQVVGYWRWPNGRKRSNNKNFTLALAHHLPYISPWWTSTILLKRKWFLIHRLIRRPSPVTGLFEKCSHLGITGGYSTQNKLYNIMALGNTKSEHPSQNKWRAYYKKKMIILGIFLNCE